MHNYTKYTGTFIVCGMGVIMLIAMIIVGQMGNNESRSYQMNGPWEVQVDGKKMSNVYLDDAVIPGVHKGSHIVLRCKMPDAQIDNAVLVYESAHSTVGVQVDGVEVYEYGQDLYKAGKMLGYGIQLISIPSDYAGKTLELTLDIAENQAPSYIVTPELYDAKSYTTDYMHKNRVALYLETFTIVFGFLTFSICCLFIWKAKYLFRLMMAAGFALCIGIWSLGDYSLNFILTENLQFRVCSEYCGLYISSLFLFLYFKEQAFRYSGKLRHLFYYVIVGLQVLFLTTAAILQITNRVHLPELLSVNHCIMAIMIIYVIYMQISDVVKKRGMKPSLFAGSIVIAIAALYAIIDFNLNKLYLNKYTTSYRDVLCVAVVVFIASLLCNYIEEALMALYSSIESQALAKMAYKDSLTGLANRRKCEEVMDEIDRRHCPVVVINFDLNHLKDVNDSLGHQEGDLFIRTFGVILEEVFQKVGTAFRTGGDEFVVISTETSQTVIDRLIQDLRVRLQEENEKRKQWNLSTAYGVAYRTEAEELSVRQAMKIADERMYENKREMKEGRC